MGEESTSPAYSAKYEDGKVVFEPLCKFEAALHDVIDTYHDDCDYVFANPLPYISAVMNQPITLRAFLRKKGLRGFYKAIGMPAYLRTEYLFPKKKKRGTARRKRKIERATKKFIKFVHDKYGNDYLIGTRATQVLIDDFFIPDGVIPPVSREEFMQKASFSAPWPGPFEGEEEQCLK